MSRVLRPCFIQSMVCAAVLDGFMEIGNSYKPLVTEIIFCHFVTFEVSLCDL